MVDIDSRVASFRLTRAEYEQLQQRAAAKKLTVSKYLTNAIRASLKKDSPT